jgi:hypothetical protein
MGKIIFPLQRMLLYLINKPLKNMNRIENNRNKLKKIRLIINKYDKILKN